jgi:hypothetical protein
MCFKRGGQQRLTNIGYMNVHIFHLNLVEQKRACSLYEDLPVLLSVLSLVRRSSKVLSV